MQGPDGQIKLSSEMTPYERLAEHLRHCPTLLKRWNGGRAQFWSYSTSHSSFSIRIKHADLTGYLEIRCAADHICGPVEWENANIQITLDQGLFFVIEDHVASVRIIAATVSVSEYLNSPPF
ncbi:MAG: hypothetical protein V4719_08845 [Planctomycetota bacterium]